MGSGRECRGNRILRQLVAILGDRNGRADRLIDAVEGEVDPGMGAPIEKIPYGIEKSASGNHRIQDQAVSGDCGCLHLGGRNATFDRRRHEGREARRASS